MPSLSCAVAESAIVAGALNVPGLASATVGGALTLIVTGVDVETAASCVNFGAFTAFLAVNLCVLFDHVGGRRELPGGWVKLLQAAAGAVAAAWLILSLRRTALAVGLFWLGLVGLVGR